MKTIVLFLILLTLITTLTAAQTPDSLLNAAATENANGYYLKAIRIYDKLIALKGDSAKYFFLRGQDQSIIKNNKAALADYSKALEINNQYFDAYISRGILYYSITEPEKSINDYNTALRYIQSNESLKGFIYNNRGAAKAMRKDLQGAYADYLEAYKLDNTSTAALENLGNVLILMDRGEEAMIFLRQLITFSPNHINARNQLGYTELKLNHFEEAVNQFDEALKLDPNQAMTLNNRSLAKFNLLDYTAALDDVNKAIELSPQNAYSFRNRALIRFAAASPESGCADLLIAVRLGYIEKYGKDARDLYNQNCGEAKF